MGPSADRTAKPSTLRDLTSQARAKGKTMNWEQVEGKWKQYAGKLKEKWGKLTDDDLTQIDGKREQLAGKIEQRYGIAKEEAERQIDEFSRALDEAAEDSRASRTHGAGR